MKKISTILFFVLFSFINNIKGQELNTFFEQSNLFFASYAQHNSVQYNLLKKDPTDLVFLIKMIGSIKIEEASKLEQKAFYINAYNLLVINSVVQHFPIYSPNEVLGFWDEMEHEVAGKKYILHELKSYILKLFSDARLHFVLVDGTVGSTGILDAAYLPELVDQQLENQTIETLNQSKYIAYNNVIGEVTISELFKKKSDDFKPSILEFINNYRVQKIDISAKIKYSNYDWALNNYFGSESVIINTKKNLKNAKTSSGLIITLPKKSVELLLFNSLFTATYGEQNTGTRSSYLNSYFSVNYGVTGTLDIGLSFLMRSSRINDYYKSSPFKTFEFERSALNPKSKGTTNLYSDWGFSHFGTQIRFAPFKKLNLTFEQGLLFPIKGLPAQNTVDESIYIITQIYYIHPFSAKLQLFLALTFWQPIQPGKAFNFQPPMLRGFLNYFAIPRVSFFISSMYLLEWGIGVKASLTSKLELQAMYSYFLPIPEVLNVFSGGATSVMTYNLGLRYRF